MRRALPGLLLLALAVAAHRGRVRLIQAWLRPGPVRVTATARPAASGPLRPVRVLLVDGLSASVAAGLPAHRRLCEQGLRLELEVGFPSVSLPVQHALWTGAWQLDSGVTFAISRLPRPLLPSLPELVPGRSAAVAESHREVVASFPFDRIVAPPEGGAALEPAELQRAALGQASSEEALVFIHTLAVDQAGHRWGAASPQYLEAARRSDELLAALLALRRRDWTLLALADHGHLGQGGHGDLEGEVRTVLACVAGPDIPSGRSLRVGMPDLTAILAERLGVAPPGACAGRSLTELLDGAPPTPAPSPGRLPQRVGLAVLALALLPLAVLGLRRRVAGARGALLPLSPVLAALLLACLGPPSLSRAYVYPAVSPLLLWVGAAVGLLLALQLGTALRRGVPMTPALLLLTAGLLAPTLFALLLGGWPLLAPPLVPFWSGWASALLEVSAVALGVLAVAALGAEVRAGRRRLCP